MNKSLTLNQGRVEPMFLDYHPQLDSPLLVGAGGWDYFDAQGDRLRAYSRLFNFVEVNTTFYHIPRLSTVRSWRKRAPRDFTFSVKCHSLVTHKSGLRPCEEAYSTLDKMRHILQILRTDMLVLQTPPNLIVDKAKVRETWWVLKSSALGDAQVFWESRSSSSPEKTRETHSVMLKAGITPIIDLTKEEPVKGATITYSRLFGASMFPDTVIAKVASKMWAGGSRAAVLTFHGSAMYRDAARFNELRRGSPVEAIQG